MTKYNDVWFVCISREYGLRIYGRLTIEFEDAVKAREAFPTYRYFLIFLNN